MDPEPDSQAGLPVAGPTEAARDAGPLGWLPRLSPGQVRLERWLGGWFRDGRLPPALDWLSDQVGVVPRIDSAEILWRASGLRRAGLIAQLAAPRLATRLALGIENPLAHAVVDRLLGFDRPFAESRLQLTPVEWGVWTFLILRGLDSLDPGAAAADAVPRRGHDREGEPLGMGDLRLDRVGPDPFDSAGLGSIVTIRWSVRLGSVDACVRLWLPEPVVHHWLACWHRPAGGSTEPAAGTPVRPDWRELAGVWRAEAGSVFMPQGLKRLRVGGVLPLTGSRLAGSPASPGGPVELVLVLTDPAGRYCIPTVPVADSGGRLLRLEGCLIHEPWPREPILTTVKESPAMSQPSTGSDPSSPAPEASAPLDVPVTLTVELGRVNLTLSRLADLKPGDVVELSRHSRAPVELTSGGRLVARGELILIDTDLGVRVTSVFL